MKDMMYDLQLLLQERDSARAEAARLRAALEKIVSLEGKYKYLQKWGDIARAALRGSEEKGTEGEK